MAGHEDIETLNRRRKKVARGQFGILVAFLLPIAGLKYQEVKEAKALEERVVREQILQNMDVENITPRDLVAMIIRYREIIEAQDETLTSTNVAELETWAQEAGKDKDLAEVQNREVFNHNSAQSAGVRFLEDDESESVSRLNQREQDSIQAEGRLQRYELAIRNYEAARDYLLRTINHIERDLERLEQVQSMDTGRNTMEEYLRNEYRDHYNDIQTRSDSMEAWITRLIQIHETGKQASEQAQARRSTEGNVGEEQEEDT